MSRLSIRDVSKTFPGHRRNAPPTQALLPHSPPAGVFCMPV